ncbi:hypothetical protein ANANG_G00256120 [Anguilla anguilla]|uniref:Uncharacterized protein n=1 Tax=Anguilla anguilla TaxID=7936 RepID=A0A9D3LVJ0_ANGAN|nr:hypothetical protein ANANG_G00256120 [Anguilla anguilla]
MTDGGPKMGQNLGPALAVGPSPGSQDVGAQILSLLGQLPSGPLEERGPEESSGAPIAGHTASAGTLVTLESREPPETRLPGACSPGAGLAPPPSPGDTPSSLQLAESFPFMSQEQLLQLLSTHSGLPSLLAPPSWAPCPSACGWGAGRARPRPRPRPRLRPAGRAAEPRLPAEHPARHAGCSGDLPVSLLGLLNAPPPAPAPPGAGGEAGGPAGAAHRLPPAGPAAGRPAAAGGAGPAAGPPPAAPALPRPCRRAWP